MASQTRYEAGTTAKFSGTIKDHNGTAIPLANIATLTLRLTNAKTGTVINSRSADGTSTGTGGANALNSGNVTVHSTSGALTWNIQAADTTLEDSSLDSESHVAEFTWTYSHSDFSGTQTGRHVHRLQCRNYLMLCTFEDVKSMAGNISDSQMPLVELLIEGFTDRVEKITNRKFKRVTGIAEVFSPRFSKWHYRVKRYPIDSITSIVEDRLGSFTGAGAVTMGTDDYAFDSETGLIKLRFRQFYDGVNSVQINYAGGLAEDAGGVPADLRLAATRQVTYWFQRRNQIGVSQISVTRQGSTRVSDPQEFLPDVARVIDDYMPKYA